MYYFNFLLIIIIFFSTYLNQIRIIKLFIIYNY